MLLFYCSATLPESEVVGHTMHVVFEEKQHPCKAHTLQQ